MLTTFFKRHLKIIAFISSILITALLYIFRSRFMGLQGYGLFGLFVLSIIGNATIILPIPVILSAFVGGAVFNPLLVALVVSLGAAIGELTGYFAGYGAGDVLEKDLKIKRVKKWMDKFGLWALFVLAAIPNPLFDVAGIIAGATEIPVYKYLLVVWLGKFVKFGAIAYLGANSIGFLDKFI